MKGIVGDWRCNCNKYRYNNNEYLNITMYGKTERIKSRKIAVSQLRLSLFRATFRRSPSVQLVPDDDMNASGKVAVSVLTNEPVHP